MEHALEVKQNRSEIASDTETKNVSYHEGDILTYICDEGYEIKSGDLKRTCGRDGKWTGTSPGCGMVTPLHIVHNLT